MRKPLALRWLVSLTLGALLALSFACGGGSGKEKEEARDTGEVGGDLAPATDTGPGTTDEGDEPSDNPCEPNPCLDNGKEGMTSCIKKSDTEYDCVCGGFYEDDGEGGCKLRAAEPGGTGVDEAADWASDNPTFNAVVRVVDKAGRPIVGARLIAEGSAYAADEEGVVRLADQPALAPIRYEVKAEGYAPSS